MAGFLQISPWTVIPQADPAASQFPEFSAPDAETARIRIRKVDAYVELWPLLTVKKTIDIPTDMELEVELENDTFHADASVVSNWTFGAGATGLIIDTITKDSATQATIAFKAALAQLAVSLSSTSHLAQLALSGVQEDDVDPTITVDLTGDTFLSEAAAENLANWTLDPATSGLTLGAVTYVGPAQVTIATTGTALAGLFAVQAKATCLTGGVVSGVATYDVATETSTCTDPLVDPVLAVALTLDTFKSELLIENLANWTFGLGTSGLTIASVTYVDDTNCTIETTGIATDTTITAMIEAAALTGAVNSGICTYNLATDASTCTQVSAGIITLMAKAAALTGTKDSGVMTANLAGVTSTSTVAPNLFFKTLIDPAEVAPTMRVVINNDALINKAAAELLSNWVFTPGSTGLTLDSVDWVNERTVDLNFTGTSAGGTFTVALSAAALMGASATAIESYTIGTAAWTGTYSQSAIAGHLDVWACLPEGFDGPMLGYAGHVAPVVSSSCNVADVDLVAGAHLDPRLRSAVSYVKDGAETAPFTVYGRMIQGV